MSPLELFEKFLGEAGIGYEKNEISTKVLIDVKLQQRETEELRFVFDDRGNYLNHRIKKVES